MCHILRPALTPQSIERKGDNVGVGFRHGFCVTVMRSRQMRLIDVDKLIKELGEYFYDTTNPAARRAAHDTMALCQNLVNEQPTAYDVNKVMEGLEALRQNEIKLLCEHESYTKDMQAMRGHNVLQDAIKIVKSGGIE